jgi:hypothetical protein
MAVLSALGGVILLGVVGGILLQEGASSTEAFWFMAILALAVLAGLLAAFPGNLFAVFPYAVEVGQRGLRLFAPFKEIFIPIEDIRDLRHSFFQQGIVVRLSRRRGLMTRFVIHWLFGPEREALAQAIELAMKRRKG